MVSFSYFIDLLFVQDIHSKAPVAQLRQMIGKRVQNADFSKHEIYLQEVLLNPNSSLHDYGFKVCWDVAILCE